MAKALRSFLKERPSYEEVDHLMAELHSDSPRAAATVGAALLDDVLLGVLRHQMKHLNEEETDALFGVDRPLGTFSSRIKLGYAIKIYGRKTRHDLDVIREVRNAFAHGRRKISFDTAEVAARIRSLHCIKDIKGHGEFEPRALFVEVTKLLMMYLVTKIGPFPAGATGLIFEGYTQLD